jgi:hypothetical protein
MFTAFKASFCAIDCAKFIVFITTKWPNLLVAIATVVKHMPAEFRVSGYGDRVLYFIRNEMYRETEVRSGLCSPRYEVSRLIPIILK